ncbi:MAG TPA: hypothetical protein VF746_16210 [Longimicrobium sp.]|jgi:hypothetical protein
MPLFRHLNQSAYASSARPRPGGGPREEIVPCPGCGRPVSREAAACPACEVPVRAMLGPRSAGTHPMLVVGVVLGGGIFLLMLLGMAAALATSRLAMNAEAEAHRGLSAADSAVVREAVLGLRTVYELQGDHMASHGAYTRNLIDPAADDYLARWRDPGGKHYGFEVSSLEMGHLCIGALPRSVESSALPVSIDGAGVVYAGPNCNGAVISENAGAEWLGQ